MAFATLKEQSIKNTIGPKDLWEDKVCFMAIPWKWTPAYPRFITYKLIYFFVMKEQLDLAFQYGKFMLKFLFVTFEAILKAF